MKNRHAAQLWTSEEYKEFSDKVVRLEKSNKELLEALKYSLIELERINIVAQPAKVAKNVSIILTEALAKAEGR